MVPQCKELPTINYILQPVTFEITHINYSQTLLTNMSCRHTYCNSNMSIGPLLEPCEYKQTFLKASFYFSICPQKIIQQNQGIEEEANEQTAPQGRGTGLVVLQKEHDLDAKKRRNYSGFELLKTCRIFRRMKMVSPFCPQFEMQHRNLSTKPGEKRPHTAILRNEVVTSIVISWVLGKCIWGTD